MPVVPRALVLKLWRAVSRVFSVAQGSRGWSSLLTSGEDWVHAWEP